MKKLIDRFGKLITASFIVMATGIITFLLVIPLYHFFQIDTDIIGLLIFDIGVVILIVGIIRRKKIQGFARIGLIILAVIFGVPVLMLIVSLIYVLITGKPLGG